MRDDPQHHILHQLLTPTYVLSDSTGVWHRQGYQGINYSDGDNTENSLLRIIKECKDVTVLSPELRRHIVDWPTRYHLSSSRANLLRPYRHLMTGKILEIGAGCGAITRYLGECGAEVLALEGSPRRAEIARARTRDLSNVTVLSERFADFKCTTKFDVITLIGVFEYASLFSPDQHPHKAMLKRIREMLTPGGSLLIAIENQFGLKYFAGALEDHVNIPMYGIEDLYTEQSVKTFGRRELQDLLEDAGFLQPTFIACFPDYKCVTSLITAAGFDEAGFDASALAIQSLAKDFLKPDVRCFSAARAWPKIIRNGLGMDLANSFLIHCSTDQNTQPFTSSILAYHYSSERLPAFTKETLFVTERPGTITADCRSLASNNHLAPQKAQDDTHRLEFEVAPRTPYVYGRILSQDFIEIVSRPNWMMVDLKNFFSQYLKIVADFTSTDTSSFSTTVAGRFIDLIPNNILRQHHDHYELIDTEWTLKESISLERLLFRALLCLVSIPGDFAHPSDGKIFTYGEFFKKIYLDLGHEMTDASLIALLEEELILQEMVSGRRDDLDQAKEFLLLPLPMRKFTDVIYELNGIITTQQQTLDRIRSSLSYKFSSAVARQIPETIKKPISIAIRKIYRALKPFVQKKVTEDDRLPR